jgi:hypothetical protein
MSNYHLDLLNKEFNDLTKDFDMDDWRRCRSGKYWNSDKCKNTIERLEFKLNCIRYYINNDKPL